MLKKYRFLGFDKDTIVKCRKNLDEDNIKTVKNISVLLITILLLLIAFYYCFDNVVYRNVVCLASAFVVFIIYMICRYMLKHREKITPRYADLLIDTFTYYCFAVGIYLGTFASGGAMAVAPVWMFFFVILIFNRLPGRNLLVIGIGCMVFIFCSYITKSEYVFTYDVLHVLISILASIYVAWTKSHLKVENILALSTLEEANMEILETVEEQEKEARMLRREVKIDGLTGLHNKSSFEQEVKAALEKSVENDQHAFVCMDVDNFKNINDSEGHLAGDKLLKEIADTIKAMFRRKDITGRFGGDEFTIFIRDVSDERTVKNKMKELLKKINASKKVSVSAGVAFYPQDGATYSQLFEKADAALYEAKKSGKNSCSMGKR